MAHLNTHVHISVSPDFKQDHLAQGTRARDHFHHGYCSGERELTPGDESVDRSGPPGPGPADPYRPLQDPEERLSSTINNTEHGQAVRKQMTEVHNGLPRFRRRLERVEIGQIERQHARGVGPLESTVSRTRFLSSPLPNPGPVFPAALGCLGRVDASRFPGYKVRTPREPRDADTMSLPRGYVNFCQRHSDLSLPVPSGASGRQGRPDFPKRGTLHIVHVAFKVPEVSTSTDRTYRMCETGPTTKVLNVAERKPGWYPGNDCSIALLVPEERLVETTNIHPKAVCMTSPGVSPPAGAILPPQREPCSPPKPISQPPVPRVHGVRTCHGPIIK
ncbi:hypothetical protein Bbelb_234380 [Branchiostoma belcheri]|nr:hypothetical protein Bbelb_234380 [Branchiostoma belcheri]